jgi:hypothetical protein
MDAATTEQIAKQASDAAKRTVTTGELEANEYPQDTDEARIWKAAYERYLLLHGSPNAEGSA